MILADPTPPPGYAAAPYSGLAALHARGPIHPIAGRDAWAVTGFALASRLLRDDRLIPAGASTFRERSPAFRAAVVHPLRKALAPPLAPDIEAVVAPVAARAVSELPIGLDVDLVAHLAQPVPMRVMMRLLGLPETDRRFLTAVSGEVFKGFVARWEHRVSTAKSADAALHHYFRHILTAGAPAAEAPLMARLLRVQHDSGMEREALANVCARLITAGVSTTAGMLANTLVRLMQTPASDLPDPADGTALAAWVEEVLRLDAPALAVERTATADLPLPGATIRAGQTVLLWLAAANRDPAQFEAPDTIRLGRRDPRHLSFGLGGFHCLGAHLARHEIRALLHALLGAPGSLRPAAPPTWTEGWMVHEARSVPAVLTPSR